MCDINPTNASASEAWAHAVTKALHNGHPKKFSGAGDLAWVCNAWLLGERFHNTMLLWRDNTMPDSHCGGEVGASMLAPGGMCAVRTWINARAIHMCAYTMVPTLLLRASMSCGGDQANGKPNRLHMLLRFTWKSTA